MALQVPIGGSRGRLPSVILGCGDRYRTWLLSSYPLLPVTFFLPSFLPNALFISPFQSVDLHYSLFTSQIYYMVIPLRHAGQDLKRPFETKISRNGERAGGTLSWQPVVHGCRIDTLRIEIAKRREKSRCCSSCTPTWQYVTISRGYPHGHVSTRMRGYDLK